MQKTREQILADEILRLEKEVQQLTQTLNVANEKILNYEKILLKLKYEDPIEGLKKTTATEPTLFDEIAGDAKEADTTEEETVTIPAYTRTRKKEKENKQSGRKGLPEHLERTEIHHEVDPSLLPDFDPRFGFTIIDHDRSEELIYTPAKFSVVVHVRPVVLYKTKSDGEATLRTFGDNQKVFSKCMASPELLARIAVDRWDSALTLYRIERWFRDHKCPLARSTLCIWMIKLGQLLEPIALAQMGEILSGFKIHVDDTNVEIQEKGNGETKTHKIWVFMGGDGTFTHIVFKTTASRNSEVVGKLLGSYTGYVQVDACSVYDLFFKQTKAIEVGCWSHVFRRFKEIMNIDKRALQMMHKIRQLCDVEDEARDLSDSQRYCLRQERSKPLLEQLKKYVDDALAKELLKTSYKDALQYMSNQWVSLTRYLKDGRLRMDNNLAEAEFHNFGITRRNHLFLGNEGVGPSAVLFGLIRTCRANAIDPYTYLSDIIRQASQGVSPEELTPQRWLERQKAEAEAAEAQT